MIADINNPPPQGYYADVPSRVKIEVFIDLLNAQEYQSKKGGMIIKEQGINKWYVMPEFEGNKQIVTMESDD